MSDQQQRYPLSWPSGWKRVKASDRQRGRFHGHKTVTSSFTRPDGTRQTWRQKDALTVTKAIQRLTLELGRLGVLEGDWLISSNLRTRLDGLPYSNAAEPDDPGVAVYFRIGSARKPTVLACDKWDRVADNIAAVAGHVEAIRAQDRYGVGTLDQAFAGYAQLPANTAANWRDVFGLSDGARWEQVEERFRELARAAHPDAGGTHEQMARLSEAKAFARKDLRV